VTGTTVRLTSDELATKLRLPLGRVVRLLEELAEEGLAERDEGNFWKLSEFAEAKFGRALRDLRGAEAA
jgi:DNA-binding IclR family transcriptional regulator